ncbi:MAG: sigma-E processing peptidase SpoIIGA [Clostridia bacterium]|nr:sigma-E processing peptidase SpoIIGA [Clostridia bacterium]
MSIINQGDGMVTVYADVLVSVNILITYIFLVCVRVIFGAPTNKFMVALASFIGGVSSVVIFFEEGSILFSILYKVLVCAVITSVAFLPGSVGRFIRLFGVFLGISLLFGGAVYLVTITLKPHNVLVNNGAIYFDMSVTYLIGVVFSVYGVFTLFEWFYLKRSAVSDTCEVTIHFRKCQVTVAGFVDTGNNMRDGLSGNPVFVVGQREVSPLFSYDEIVFLKGECTEQPPESLKPYYRVLPCTTATGQGLLPAFVPHSVVLQNGNRIANAGRVTLCISPAVSASGQGGVLLNKCIYDLDWKGTDNDESLFSKFVKGKK